MSQILESGEMYLENILILQQTQKTVRAIDLANFTGYSKPSISRALGVLKDKALIEVDRDGYITLTDIGFARAAKIYERHTILTEFFVKIGVDPEVAAADACKVEHDISDATFECIKKRVK